MNCHQKSESHVWRYSKHNKVRRCVKCKSKLPITKEEFALKWGVKKNIEKSTDSEKKKFEHEEMKEEQHQLDLKENYESDEKYEDSKD
jgi:hypothetical protein